MNHVLTFVRRLAPFESIWLILFKVFILNRLPGKSVINLIRHEEAELKVPFRWWSTSDLSIARLEAALQLEKGELFHCHIDNFILGNPGIVGSTVRHCPECLKKRYHSVIFDLPSIKVCPWHGRELFSCTSCHQTLEGFRGRSRCKYYSVPTQESICEHLWHFLDGLPVHSLSEGEVDVIKTWFSHFTSWLNKSTDAVGFDVHHVLGISNNRCINFALKFIEQRTKMLSPLPLSLSRPVKRIIIPQHKRAWLKYNTSAHNRTDKLRQDFRGQCKDHPLIQAADMVACLKAVRRQIKKRFLKNHKHCVNQLSKLTRMQAMNLDPSSTCSCAVAYVVWQINILEIEAVSDIFSVNEKHFRTPIEVNHYPLSLFHLDLVQCVRNFIELWGAIEVLPEYENYSKITVSRSIIQTYAPVCRAYSYDALPMQTTVRWPDDYGCYVIDPEYLQWKSLEKCCGMRGRFSGTLDICKQSDSAFEYFPSNHLHIYCFKVAGTESLEIYNIMV